MSQHTHVFHGGFKVTIGSSGGLYVDILCDDSTRYRFYETADSKASLELATGSEENTPITLDSLEHLSTVIAAFRLAGLKP